MITEPYYDLMLCCSVGTAYVQVRPTHRRILLCCQENKQHTSRLGILIQVDTADSMSISPCLTSEYRTDQHTSAGIYGCLSTFERLG